MESAHRYFRIGAPLILEWTHQSTGICNEEGKPCEKLYSEAFHLKQHLFDRLDSEDDEEVERLVDCLLEIGNITSMKMFDYGWYYAQKSLKLKSLQHKILR